MANSRRRKSSRRSRRARLPTGLVAAFIIVALIVLAVALVNRQIKGYFTLGPHRQPAAIATESPTPGQPAPASPYPTPSGQAASTGPKVAIIIDDCGYNVERCRRFLEMPIPITLSILPMTPHGKEIEAAALAAGKSVMLHLPMEPDSPQANPGPGAVTTDMSDGQVQAQVETDIDSVPDVPGVNNHMGSKATGDPRVMRDVLEVLQKHHLFFIDSMTSNSTVGASTARELGIPTAERSVFLDNFKDLPYIAGQFKQVEEVAVKRGTAIAIGHPNETTAQALAEAIPKMQADGITFVPAATLVK